MKSLWGDDFVIEKEPEQAKKILSKIDKPKKIKTEQQILKSKNTSIEEKLNIINRNVYNILGVYKENTLVIKDIETFSNYIDKAIQNGIIAIDTETNNSLDPLTCKLMGPCIYTTEMKNAYIPVNHVNYVTNEKYDWQITEQQVKEQFDRLVKNDVKIITHNGKFDYEVLKCTTGFDMPIYWDTMIGARLLNENERAGLKQQYIEKIDSSIEKYSIDHLFDIDYAVVSPEVFALYAATDSFMTYKLYEYQKAIFEQPENEKLYSLFMNVEMKVMPVVCSMELQGVNLDDEYCSRLSKKYNDKLNVINDKINAELEKLSDIIDDWRKTDVANYHPPSKGVDKNGNQKLGKSKNEQLKNPPELSSPTQLSILLYDILNAKVYDKNNPRGTGEEILQHLKDDIPLCSLMLEKRGLEKLINAFIDALPKLKSEKDNKIHSNFKQLGTDTGRFSSSEPNIQQIPSSNKEIRMMFKASDGYVFVGSDYSQQEPRLMTAYSNDEKMLNAYQNGKDLYATMGTGVYNNDYWDNMEHYEDGTPNIEGKKRRSLMKKLLLGLLYGMGANLLAENLGCTVKEADKIVKDFYTGFPKVQEWIKKTESDAMINGYVEDFWGRRRRLPDLLLPKIEVKNSKFNSDFNPLLGSKGQISSINKDRLDYYEQLALNCKSFKELNNIKSQAEKEGIYVKDNSGFISRSMRQCVNARVQGGAATMTKKAMIAIYNDKEINDLGFRLLIGVHDELIGECPKENKEKVAERLSYLMKTVVPELSVPFKCDAEIEEHWYENDYSHLIQNEYNKLLKDGVEKEKALKIVQNAHYESAPDKIKEYCFEI